MTTTTNRLITHEGTTTMSIHPGLMEALVQVHVQELRRNSQHAPVDRDAAPRRRRFRRKR
jgi:hypothetical protein